MTSRATSTRASVQLMVEAYEEEKKKQERWHWLSNDILPTCIIIVKYILYALLAAGVIVDVWLGCKVIYSFVYGIYQLIFGIYSFVCSSAFFIYSLTFSCCFWCCIASVGFFIASFYFGWMNTFPQCIMSLAFVSFLKGDASSFLYDSGWPIFGIAALGGFISYSICLICLLV